MAEILPHSFFNRPADIVARALIGCNLCIKRNGTVTRHTITETEAYMGPHDLACHASRGRTKRTEVMYMSPGTMYVYFIYGMYEMLNFVTGKEGYPAAVLIRGAGTYDGPGKLTRAIGITRELNGKLLSRKSGLWVEKPQEKKNFLIEATPRIGISYARKEWTEKKLRFVLVQQ